MSIAILEGNYRVERSRIISKESRYLLYNVHMYMYDVHLVYIVT